MKKLFLSILICFLFLNCENKDVSSKDIDAKNVEYKFYNPKFNTFNNVERKIVYNVDLLKTEEMEVIKNGLIKNLTDISFNKLAGITIIYDNAILFKNVEFTKENILGLMIYELDDNNLMKHRFFIKNQNNKYEEKVSLLENMMSTANQFFIIYKFFPDFYEIKTIGLSTLTDVTLDRKAILKQKNEFDLFRVAETYKNFNSEFKDEQERRFVEPACNEGCEEGYWDGICDAGVYCNKYDDGGSDDGGGICEDKEKRKQTVIDTGLLTETVANSLFNLELHRSLKNNLMKNYDIGKKHIAYYYAISGYLQNDDYQTTTLIKMISTLPDFNSSVEKLVDQNYNGNDIIITQSLLNDIYLILEDLKNISNDPNYQFILNDLENDLNTIKNKTKAQLLNDLN